MRVGLVRHFKVKKEFPKGLISSAEVMKWFEEYETTEIEEGETDLGGIEWQQCFASDLPRAARTAEIIYNGPIVHTERLREIPVHPIGARWNLTLPFLCWAVLMRLALTFNHSAQQESTTAVEKRVQAILDDILAQDHENVLIVSHGALMFFLRKELLKRGFKGPKLRTPQNGKLYLFEK